MKIKKVLVPVDFSPPSTLAVNYGVALARKFRAGLTLLHVIEPSGALLYTFPTEAKKVEQRRLEQAHRMLPALVGPEDQDDLDLQVVVKSGAVEHEIAETVREQGVDAVVMGTHGRRLLGRWFIGSVTQSMLRRMPVPVLTVSRVSRPLGFHRVLFATELSEASADGFRRALDFAETLGAKLLVAHVLEERPRLAFDNPVAVEYVERARREQRENARNRFEEFRTEAELRNVTLETLLLDGPAGDSILKAVTDNAVDIVVITVQERGFVERALGSTAEFLIRESAVPVFSIPVPARASSEAAASGREESTPPRV